MKKLIIFILLFLINSSLFAQNKQSVLVLTRTISQLPIKLNKQIISISDNNEVELIYPETHRFYSDSTIKKKTTVSYNHLFNQIDTSWSTSTLRKKTNLNKTKRNNQYFHSSDPNLIELSLFENGEKIWSIAIDNIEEMKFYNRNSKKLSLLFSIIDEMDSISTQFITTQIKEVGK